MSFLNDKRGRVPFAVLGIFLLVGSTVTSGVITNLERKYSQEITIPLEYGSVGYLVEYAESDIARVLCYSCLEALQKVGELPVTYSDLSTQAAKDYADFNENGYYDPTDLKDNKIDTYPEVVKFNKNWARNMARVHFNSYLNATFRHNIHQDKGYAINIFDSENNGAIDDWRDIKFEDIEMKLNRSAHVNALISENSNMYPTYLKASIKNFKIEICDLSSGKSWIKTINVSCLIPSRLSLLMGLTETYQSSINGISPLTGLVTVIGEGYTEVRSLLQYAGKYDWVANIVDNRWLQYLTNAGLIGIQYLVFNSIDPMTLVYLAININDLISKSNIADADKYVKDGTEDLIKDKILSMVSLPINDRENIFKTFGNKTDNEAKSELNKLIGSQQLAKGNVSIWHLSRDILNESVTTYYYYNNTADSNLLLEEQWMGYSFTKNGYKYHLSTEDGDPDENIASIKQSFVRNYSSQINSAVLQNISKEIHNTYKASFVTNMTKTKIGESYSNSFSGEWRGHTDNGSWDLVSSTSDGNILRNGELPPSIPYYKEDWILKWEREEKWEHKECHTEQVGNDTIIVCDWIPHAVTHYYTERATFSLTVSDYPEHIQGIFHHKSVFGIPPHEQHTDDNLEFLLQKYVDNYFTPLRDRYTDTTEDTGRGENKILDSVTWNNNTADSDITGYNRISWILGQQGKMGEAVAALYNITEMIKSDRGEYSNISDRFYSEGNTVRNLSIMEEEREMLLDEFRRNEPRYINSDYYMDITEYKSAAAKVILDMRRWFVDEIEKKLSTSHVDKAVNEIDNQLESHDTGNFNSYQDYKNTTDKYKDSVANLGDIQFGSQMKLNKENEWSENITLTISSKPNYFDFNNPPSEEEGWQFNIKNLCLFGPTGLPLLPTPVTPWIVTINSWYIHVDGHWDTFKVLDSSDETHADPLFGHTGQIYNREESKVKDKVCYKQEIGICERLNFEFDTMSLGIVPPGKLPIGDLSGGIDEANNVGS
ncbi:MAG: hypothetical protein U9O96_02810 [Candidatus Thermoplasmatota archaeon]|nr:hypothetical protein [Candidatus Thermoplasmatota archaeon]